MSKSLEQRFWEKVKKTESCWIWSSAVIKAGYGVFSYRSKSIRAHRFSYELYWGNIPKGLNVLHRCDNTLCVNPNHLFLGTQKDNMNDMFKKDRQCSGELHPNHKLTEEQVISIRSRYLLGSVLQKDLAKEFNVGKKQINYIIHNKVWKHI